MSANEWNYPARFREMHDEMAKIKADLKCHEELTSAVQKLFIESKADNSKLKSRVLELEIQSVEKKFSQEAEKGICRIVNSAIKRMMGGSK